MLKNIMTLSDASFYFLLGSIFLLSCGEPLVVIEQPVEEKISTDSEFDQELADRLGADDYGMKSYVMAFLKSGPNRDQDSLEAVRLQAAHMENIGRMADEGTLVVAGPFLDNGDIRGIYIFDVQTIAEAEALTKTDPAIQAGRLIMELHPWYGSAALMEVGNIHPKIQKTSF